MPSGDGPVGASPESFIRGMENGFRAFGGVTATVVDNLKAAVKRVDWFDPDINPKVRDFAAHYGTVFLPTRPAMPRHRGKVEAGVKYAQANALRGRKFTSLSAQNGFLLEWERTIADTRIHGTTRKQVAVLFAEVEAHSEQMRSCQTMRAHRRVRNQMDRCRTVSESGCRTPGLRTFLLCADGG